MDLDELKDEAKKVKAPDLGALDFGGRVRTVDGLVDELKRRDAAEKKRLCRFMAMFGLFGVLISMSALQAGITPAVRLGRGLIAFIYFLVIALSVIKSVILARVDYAEPTRAFLEKAEKRYRYIGPWEWLYIVPGLVVAGFAGWLLTASGFDHLAHRPRAAAFDLIYVLGFLAVCALGFVCSRKSWKRDKGPLHDRLVRAVKDFSEGV